MEQEMGTGLIIKLPNLITAIQLDILQYNTINTDFQQPKSLFIVATKIK